MARNVVSVENYSRYFFIASFLALFILSVYLIKSYIITIVSSVLLAYIFYPLYKSIKRKLGRKKISAFITIVLIILIIFIPLIFAANALLNQTVVFFHKTKDIDLSSIEETIAKYTDGRIEIGEYITDGLNKLSLSLAKQTSDFLVSLPKKILALFVMIFLMYYLFTDGKKLIEKIQSHIPLRKAQKEELSERFSNVIYASIFGIIVTAFVQGAVGALGLWIFKVNSPLVWGLVMVIISILPFLGASLVWLPAAVYQMAVGDIFNGVGLLIYGILIISTVDNIVRPGIIGSRGNIHPALVLLGVLGGLEIFGLLGIIIGPVILSILTVFAELYLLEKNDNKPKPKKEKRRPYRSLKSRLVRALRS